MFLKFGKAVLVLVVLVVAGTELLYHSNKTFRDARNKSYHDKCFRHYDVETQRGDFENEQKRRKEEPVSILGKLNNFALCARISSLNLGLVEIESGPSDALALEQGAVVAALASVSLQLVEGQGVDEDVLDRLEKATTAAVGETIADRISTVTQQNDSTENNWLLIVGADQSDEAALHEVRKLQNAIDNLPSDLRIKVEPAQIYRIRTWRRTVAVFVDQASAKAALAMMQDDLNEGSYLRSEAAWCKTVTENSRLTNPKVSICDPT